MSDHAVPENHAIERPPRGIPWTDLTEMGRWATLKEISLPLPWLIAQPRALCIPVSGIFGAIASFMFYLCALRLNHEAIHGNLGLNPAAATGWSCTGSAS